MCNTGCENCEYLIEDLEKQRREIEDLKLKLAAYMDDERLYRGLIDGLRNVVLDISARNFLELESIFKKVKEDI